MEILVVLSRVPYPLDKGDKLRAYHQLKILSKHHNISLFCLNEGNIHPNAKTELKKLCSRLEVVQFSKLQLGLNLIKSFRNKFPFQVNYFLSKTAIRKFDAFIEERIPDIIFCQLVRTAEYTKKYNSIPSVIDYMDSLSSAMERRIKKSGILFKSLVSEESKRLANYENSLTEYFDGQTIISKQDKKLLPLKNKNKVKVLPNGVDTTYFSPKEIEKKYDFVFVGNMAYPPNVDAVCHFVEDILPKIKKENPNVSLLISGTSPVKKVLALKSKNITITGFVEDIRDSYASAKVFVAPLRMGAGLQNKILEAMAMKIPFVASSVAYNALGMEKHNLRLAVTDEKFANNCIKLLNDKDKRKKEGEALREFVTQNFSWASRAEELNQLFKEISAGFGYVEQNHK